ncbi:MAG TPA: hypothetical protein VMD97_05375 [Candidatus Aquilonibacter sp.]|nr:hypothetical protein [Candidatus Aquilonibacter sp.]
MKRLLLISLLLPLIGTANAQAPSQPTGVLSPTQLQAVFPATVYFNGQMTTAQMRNTGGVRWSEGKQTLFGMVDSGGYSTGMRERYQFYILTDVPVEIDGKHLPAGAYGAGFLTDRGFEVMDLGGTELFHAPVQHDAGMRRPRPLLVTAAANGHYRLYLGRDYVEFSR